MSANRSHGTKKGWGTMPRRTFLKGAGTVAVAASAGGLPGLLTAGQAPAYAKGTKLHMLQWLNFDPPAIPGNQLLVPESTRGSCRDACSPQL